MADTEPERKEITVKIDASPREQRLQADFEKKIAEKDELIRTLLAQEKKEFVEKKRVPEEGGDTAPLETQVQTIKIDEESEILDFVRFKSPEEACNFLKECASNPHRGDYKFAQQLYGKAVKKILKENGSWQFEGNLSKWERRGSKVVKADRKPEFRKVVD